MLHAFSVDIVLAKPFKINRCKFSNRCYDSLRRAPRYTIFD